MPNVSFDFYQIAPLKMVQTPFLMSTIQSQSFQTGFLTLDQNKRVLLLGAHDSAVSMYPIVGLWVTGLPQFKPSFDESSSNSGMFESDMKNNPLVWAACLRFILCKKFKEVHSPSKDMNTFLVVNIPQDQGHSIKP